MKMENSHGWEDLDYLLEKLKQILRRGIRIINENQCSDAFSNAYSKANQK